MGALGTTPSSECHIDANVEPLRLCRERFTALTIERYKRMEEDNPCRKMVEEWTPTERIKKQAQRRAAAETVARKLIEHLKHSMYHLLRHHNC